MMRQKQDNEKRSGRSKPRTSQKPEVEEHIRSSSWKRRKLILDLERTAFDPSKDKDAKLVALSKLYKKREELDKKIERTRAELRKMTGELLEKREHLKKMLIGKYGEHQGRLEYQKDISGNDPTNSRRMYLEELEKCRNSCQFALERLTSSPEIEIRNKAFDLIQDNLVAVKLTCLDSPYRDIRQRASEVLRKDRENRYFSKPQQKHCKEIIPFPMILIR